MSAFYTFLLSLYNCLLKLISLILLGEVRTFFGEVLKISGEASQAHLPAPLPKIRPWFCRCLYPSMIVDAACFKILISLATAVRLIRH